MLQTTKSNPAKPARIMIGGVEGVGKTSFGAYADDPVFIPLEDGADQATNRKGEPIDVMKKPKTWDEFLALIDQVRHEPHKFKTLVLDSSTWIEKLAFEKIRDGEEIPIGQAAGGYGNAFDLSRDMHWQLFEKLEDIRINRGMNIIITAHVLVKTFKDPLAAKDYDTFQLAMHEKNASAWRQWVDLLMFCKFDQAIKVDEKNKNAKPKAFVSGDRTAYFTKQGPFEAKNRYGLPPKLPFTFEIWDTLKPYLLKKPMTEQAAETYAEIQSLLLKMEDGEVKTKVVESSEKYKDNANKLVTIRDKLIKLTEGK